MHNVTIDEVLLGRASKMFENLLKGIRYHPMIIRYCLSLVLKLVAAYDEIQYNANKGTGFAILPADRGYVITKII